MTATADTRAAFAIHGTNAYELSRLADCGTPDGCDSLGARWLRRIAEAFTEVDAPEQMHNPEHWQEIADSAVPIYTYERWQIFTDLAAYHEDVSELTGDSRDRELSSLAGLALYMIAERLCAALADEYV